MPNIMRYLCVVTVICAFLCPTGIAAAACLGYGSHGRDVVSLQVRLNELGYNVGKPDGEFGRHTQLAVERFQVAAGLKKTGFVDNDTWQMLNTIKRRQPVVPPASSGRDQLKQHRQKPAVHSAKPAAATVRKPPVTKDTYPSFKYGTPAEKIVADARRYIGTPYVWGGQTPRGFDCSGFVQYVFANNGIQLPRTADLQYKKGLAIRRENLQKGDVVFFTTYTAGASHDGIYVGDGKFISATSSRGIAVDNLDSSYWKTRYLGAKRINGML